MDVDRHMVFEDWDPGSYRQTVPWPAEDADKYSRGQLVVVAGSAAYPGAAVLAASAGARSGAGYTLLCTPRGATTVAAQAHLVSVPVVPCPETKGAFAPAAADRIVPLMDRATAVVCGPGMTVTEGTRGLVARLITSIERPLLLDADALTIAGELRPQLLERAYAGRMTVLTPHEGEAARLLAALGAENLLAADASTDLQRYNAAVTLSSGYGATVVLKGPRSLIAAADGRRVVRNPSGCAALATAGTGDVLAGLIGGLLACGLPSLDAAALGAYLHGLAGEEAARTHTALCVMAEDVIDALPQALKVLYDGEEQHG